MFSVIPGTIHKNLEMSHEQPKRKKYSAKQKFDYLATVCSF